MRVSIGTIALVYRWIIAARFRFSKIVNNGSFKEEVELIEGYWTGVGGMYR